MGKLLADMRRLSLRPIICVLFGALVGLFLGMAVADYVYPNRNFKGVDKQIATDAQRLIISVGEVGAVMGGGLYYALRSAMKRRAARTSSS